MEPDPGTGHRRYRTPRQEDDQQERGDRGYPNHRRGGAGGHRDQTDRDGSRGTWKSHGHANTRDRRGRGGRGHSSSGHSRTRAGYSSFSNPGESGQRSEMMARFNGAQDNGMNSNNNPVPVPLSELEFEPTFERTRFPPGQAPRHDRDSDGRRGRFNRHGGRGGGSWNNWRGMDAGQQPKLNPNAAAFEPQSNSSNCDEGTTEDSHVSDVQDRNENSLGGHDRKYNRNKGERNHRTRRDRNFERPRESNAERESWAGGLPSNNEQFQRSKNLKDDRSRDPVAPPGKSKNQREVLMDQLSRNAYECMVCCEKVRHLNPIWSCKRCYNVFHMSCIRKWASSSVDETGWRCPGCQSCYENDPGGYYCFCGKTKNPKSSRYDVPHTCGRVCEKPKPGGLNCTHNCVAQCHPGPCPSCEVQQVRYCGCGKTNAQVLCGSKTVLCCGGVCNKKLTCGVHTCGNICHLGDCKPCEAEVVHKCFCGNEQKKVPCTPSANQCKSYSCSRTCNEVLSCKMHRCESICHQGPCDPCKTSPEAVISCPCGQTPIDEACSIARVPKRTKCTDPVPTCGKTCLHILPCGDVDNKHKCQKKCHLSKDCPPCGLISSMKCRCGGKVLEIPCKELLSLTEVTCQKKCNKKRSCGKHKCNTKCCIEEDHICPIVCQGQLRCGKHSCTRLCHLNPCPPCDIVSFDELACECGAAIIYPPVPCGTRRPPCQLPCSREHTCDHPVHHPCHSEANCPPCTVLTEKWCHGKHELRKNIMCHITEVSCGLPCGKMLSCQRHTCRKICHAGPCLKDKEVCKLPCEKLRNCGHHCGAPCHESECPDAKCKVMTEVVCPCGRRIDSLVCWRREIEYDRTVTWEYHKELKKLEEEGKARKEEIEITDALKSQIMSTMKERIPKSAVLECDKECARLERNRKMAEALQLDNVDVSTSVGTPNYSEFLTKFAKKNPQFIEMVHKQLTDLVMKAKQSRKKNETYGFNSMNRDKRHVIHEYSDHFGILSESFDEEPNRNVICFASREKSYLPSVSLIDAVFRPAVHSERLRPNDDVSFRPERRTQIVGPSQWNMKVAQKSPNESKMVALNIPGTPSGSSDFPPL